MMNFLKKYTIKSTRIRKHLLGTVLRWYSANVYIEITLITEDSRKKIPARKNHRKFMANDAILISLILVEMLKNVTLFWAKINLGIFCTHCWRVLLLRECICAEGGLILTAKCALGGRDLDSNACNSSPNKARSPRHSSSWAKRSPNVNTSFIKRFRRLVCIVSIRI